MKTQKRWISMLLTLILLFSAVPVMNEGRAATSNIMDSEWEYSEDNKLCVIRYFGTSATPSIPTYVQTVGAGCFKNNAKITSVNLNNVKYIGASAFEGCENLATVTGLNKVIEIGEYAFSGCKALGAGGLTLNNSLPAIEKGTFLNCIALTKINIPAKASYIGAEAFSACTSLTSADIPSTVGSIGANAFDSCTSLKTIKISGSVTTVGDDAFKNCPKLTITCYRGSAAEKYAQDHKIPYTSLDPVIDTITISPNGPMALIYYVSATGTYADQIQFTASVTPAIASESPIQWTSSNPAVVSIDQTGVATMRKAQAFAEIWASGEGTDGKRVSSNHVIIHVVSVSSSFQEFQCHDGKTHSFLCTSTSDTPLTNTWKKYKGSRYYFGQYGWRMESTWAKDTDNVHWCYLLPTGKAAKGWKYIKVGSTKFRYYFDKKTCQMVTGWLKIGKKWYYLGSDQLKDVGTYAYRRINEWIKVGGKYYYMNGKGQMAVGWQKINGKKYYFDTAGIRQTGWLELKGATYYLNPKKDGEMVTRWQKISGKWYFFKDGKMLTKGTRIDGKMESFGKDGVWKGKGNPPVDPTSVVISKKKITMSVGKKRTLKGTVKPTYAYKDIVWESSDTSIASVSQKGVVTAKHAGTCTITVIAYGHDGYLVEATCKVVVK